VSDRLTTLFWGLKAGDYKLLYSQHDTNPKTQLGIAGTKKGNGTFTTAALYNEGSIGISH